MTNPKEPNFFNKFDQEDAPNREALEIYLNLYSTATKEKVIGEASVSYMSSIKAMQHIQKLYPDSKILVSLRNPLQRICSLYEMYVRHGLKQPFSYTIRTDPWLLNQCLYYDPTKRILDSFSRQSVLFIDFSDLVENWSATLQHIHDFLSVNHIPPDRPTLRNKGGVPVHPSLRILTNRNVIKLSKMVFPEKFHEPLDRKVKNLFFSKIGISREDTLYLSKAFSEDIRKLDGVLGSRYFDKWIAPNL